MRLILTILLIGLLKADAQIVINASAPYRSLSICGDTTRLLNSYSNSVSAFSLRKLRSEYTGSAIRVRRDSIGQTESDIGFDACGFLDTVALKNFVRNNSAFVVTWYDQSGSSPARNVTNSVSTGQPQIVNAGTIERYNNKVALRFDGTFDILFYNTGNTNIFQNTGAGSIYTAYRWITNPTAFSLIYFASVTTPNSTTTRGAIGGGSTSNRHSILARRLDGDAASILSGSTATNTSNIVQSTAHFDWTNGDGFIYLNGSSEATNTSFTTSGNTSNTVSINSCIGGIKTPSTQTNLVNAHILEVIIYNNIDNRSGIESNINSFYGIY